MKTAIITGASSGLGREFARQLTDIFPCLLYTSDAADE